MLIGSRSGFIGNGLPYDREVEYLESTGTQWIDTEVYANQSTTADLYMASTKGTSGGSWMFGSRVAYGNSMFTIYNGSDVDFKYTFGWGKGGKMNAMVSNVSSADDSPHLFHIARSCGIDNVMMTENGNNTFVTPTTLMLFGAYTNEVIYKGVVKIFWCHIFNSNIIVRDFIPVRKGKVGYMYDKVSKRLFGNQGTGSFIIGPDKVGGGVIS